MTELVRRRHVRSLLDRGRGGLAPWWMPHKPRVSARVGVLYREPSPQGTIDCREHECCENYRVDLRTLEELPRWTTSSCRSIESWLPQATGSVRGEETPLRRRRMVHRF